jgi:hypothetical protein
MGIVSPNYPPRGVAGFFALFPTVPRIVLFLSDEKDRQFGSSRQVNFASFSRSSLGYVPSVTSLPVTSLPVTSLPVTPLPVTPLPVTPLPVTWIRSVYHALWNTRSCRLAGSPIRISVLSKTRGPLYSVFFEHTTDMLELPYRFATVRMAVGFLGQTRPSAWWSSSFLSPNGLAIAEYNFPRAAGYAAQNATAAAAKRLHDERIGKRRCVHLFRLALAEEVLIQRTLQPNGRALLDLILGSRDDALKVLEAESREVISVEAGPVQIGAIEDAFTEAGLSELAKHYFAAFRQGVQCLPYFANARK